MPALEAPPHRGEPVARAARAPREPGGREGIGTRLRRLFLPGDPGDRMSRASRPLALVVLLLIVAWPAWRAWRGPIGDSRPVQVVDLYPVRGGTGSRVDLSAGGDVEIRFVLEGAGPGDACDVRLVSGDGVTVFARDGFDEFSDEGLGIVRLPVALLSPVRYALRLLPRGRTDERPLGTYTIRAVR